MAYGRLFLIPSTLGGDDPSKVIPAPVLDILKDLHSFVVEDTRSARRFLSSAGLKGHIGELEFRELNEHTRPEEVEPLIGLFSGPEGEPNDVGLISEAGLPAVADPGSALVALCHRRGIQVVPLVGPSSLMLALMASGLNGQSFAFQGYLPAKPEERRKAIRDLEKRSAQLGQTELFIETPYRNDSMMADLMSVLQPSTKLCVAANITLPDETILTKTVKEWRAASPTIGKRPCVFLLLAK